MKYYISTFITLLIYHMLKQLFCSPSFSNLLLPYCPLYTIHTEKITCLIYVWQTYMNLPHNVIILTYLQLIYFDVITVFKCFSVRDLQNCMYNMYVFMFLCLDFPELVANIPVQGKTFIILYCTACVLGHRMNIN